MNIALIISAGKGTRINSNIPKQFIQVKDKEMLCYTIDAFQTHPFIDEIIIVTLKDYIDKVKGLCFDHRYTKVTGIVAGGETRQESVRNGLNFIKGHDDDTILIHDGDRPFIETRDITRLIEYMKTNDSAVLVVKENDSLIPGVSNAGRKAVYDDVPYIIQTPQCFKLKNIRTLHNRLSNLSFSDDASLLDHDGQKVNLVIGDKQNIKITTDDDLKYFKEKVNSDEQV